MDDPQMIRAVLHALGLGTRSLRCIQDRAVKDRLLSHREGSAAPGVPGSPTSCAGGEMFFGKDRLSDVEEAIEAAKAAGR
jgi:2-hydroxychromene-2-carboxylate isomerase